MAAKAKVFLVESKYDNHDLVCIPVESRHQADILAYAVEGKYERHDLKVYLTKSPYGYPKPKKIFFTEELKYI